MIGPRGNEKRIRWDPYDMWQGVVGTHGRVISCHVIVQNFQPETWSDNPTCWSEPTRRYYQQPGHMACSNWMTWYCTHWYSQLSYWRVWRMRYMCPTPPLLRRIAFHHVSADVSALITWSSNYRFGPDKFLNSLWVPWDLSHWSRNPMAEIAPHARNDISTQMFAIIKSRPKG